jgi:hypothetical protein
MDWDTRLALLRGWAFARQGAAIVAIDPSARSTGWAVLRSQDATVIGHGQDEPRDAFASILTLIGDQPIGILSVEEPHLGGIVTDNTGKLFWAAGWMHGRLTSRMVDEDCIWKPKPSTWRAWLGLNKGPGFTRKRDDVNAGIHLWSQTRVHDALRSAAGAPQFDRANAIALAYATQAAALAAVEQQERREP